MLTNSDTPGVVRGISDRLDGVLLPGGESPGSAIPVKPAEVSARLFGTWKGSLAHPDGDLPLTLEWGGPGRAKATFGSSTPVDLSDVSLRRGRMFARVDAKLAAQAFYHGTTTLEFHLDPRGDRLTGVVAAVGPGYFHLPHWVDLARQDKGAKSEHEDRPEYDLIFRGGRIVDGCGTPWYRGDVGIRDGKIATIGRLDQARAARIVDATNLIVAPGFVDMMGQTAAPFLKDPRAGDNLLTQGITTINAGEGDSDAPLAGDAAAKAGWSTMAEYFDRLDRQGMPLNMVQTVGHTQVRRIVLGDTDRKPSAEDLERMKGLVREGMEAGAVGVSTSLIYPPATYASTDEIAALTRVAGEYGGRYFTHMRNEGDRLLEAIDEAIAIGDAASTPVHIFHLKTAGRANWPKMDLAIARIKAARVQGKQVGADIYPYLNNGLGIESFIHPRHSAEGAEGFRRKLDDAASRAEIRREMEGADPWENWYRHIGRDWDHVVLSGMTAEPFRSRNGQSLGEIARALGRDPWDVFFDLAKTGAFALPQSMSEANKIVAMRQEFVSFDTDAGPAGGSLIASHPRAFGAFPRVLSRYVRELGVLSLEQAIARMTSIPANELGLHDRGRIVTGLAADLVVFDPLKICDRATLGEPALPSEGVQFVAVGGKLVVDEGEPTELRPGRVLRGPGYRRAASD